MNKTLTIISCVLITSCSTVSNIFTSEDVKPWEKDILAQQDMQIPPDKMFSYSDDHIYFSKEASTGGNSVGGGGCGCN
jgi:hypothetical protein